MSRIQSAGRAVLVTGCSSGIGRATATYLAYAGFTVFATVRKEADAEALRQPGEPNLVPVCPLDLSRLDDIPQVARVVEAELGRRQQTGLYAVVNNAGAGETAPIELLDLDRFRTELAARILGPVALLQAFLPMLRAGHGRVLWITTPGLMPIPYVSSIHVPDFAANCLARTLDLELKRWRIPSIMIRCGTIQTAAPARAARELREAMQAWPADRLALYQETLAKECAELGRMDEKRTPPARVAETVHAALTAARPQSRYSVGRLSGLAAALELLPQTVVDRIMAARG